MKEYHNKAVGRINTDKRGAVLLSGPRGLYQMSDALALAEKALGEPALAHPDFMMYMRETDKAQIGIDVVLEIAESLNMLPARAKRRVVLIDGAEGLTPVAQNKFLKVLEEGDAFFILISYGEVLATIKSRTMFVAYRPLPYPLFKELTGEDETVYFITGGCPELVDHVNMKELFGQCGKALQEGNVKELLGVLHMVKEKDKTSFFATNRSYVSSLFAYFGKCFEHDYEKAKMAAEASIRCVSPTYVEADFFMDLAMLLS